MTPGLVPALGAMLCFGASDLVYKRGAAAGIKAGDFLAQQAWIYCPGITLYSWLIGALDLHVSALWGLLAGLFLFGALYNFTQSLHGGAVSTNAPIFRLNFTLTAVMAIALLGEPLTLAKAVALACALAAVWLLLGEAETETRQSNAGSLARVIVATVAMAFANLFSKIGLQNGALPETMICAQAWVFCPLATLAAYWPERRLNVPPHAWPYAGLAALALFCAFLLLMHALAVGPASVLVPVGQMSFVITALVGIGVYGERLDGRKAIGLAIAAVALVLFAMS